MFHWELCMLAKFNYTKFRVQPKGKRSKVPLMF